MWFSLTFCFHSLFSFNRIFIQREICVTGSLDIFFINWINNCWFSSFLKISCRVDACRLAPDQTVQMSRLIWSYTVCIWPATFVACGRLTLSPLSRMPYADSVAPDQPAHPRSLIWELHCPLLCRIRSHWPISVCVCAGWSGATLSAYIRRPIFAWRGSYVIRHFFLIKHVIRFAVADYCCNAEHIFQLILFHLPSFILATGKFPTLSRRLIWDLYWPTALCKDG